MLKFVDVGGSEGLHERWWPHLDNLDAYLFEPNPEEAEKIRQKYAATPNIRAIEKALWNADTQKTLHLAANFGCTSIRKPDMPFLTEYSLHPYFELVGSMKIDCRRYDHLYAEGLVPSPDAVKIDVQGCEYEVLEGFGDLLDDCLCIELESHFYPIYRNQKLIGDLVSYLEAYDFVLRRIGSTPHFQGDAIEVDAIFTPSRERLKRLTNEQNGKLEFLKGIYGA